MSISTVLLIIPIFVICFLPAGDAIYCYRCVSTHPGCYTPFNWLWHTGQYCPEPDDTCVKIIERKGATEIFTRDCLSALKSFRTDIPADHYEGCRPASRDVKLAHYVNNSINELDIRRDYYDSVTWCFCFFDDRCNGAGSLVSSITMALSLSTIALLMGRL